MAEDEEVKTTKGGARRYFSFSVTKEIALSEYSIKKAFDYNCNCDQRCMWEVMHRLTAPYDTVESLRAARFAGATHNYYYY